MSQGLTALTVQLLDNPLIEHGAGMAGLVHELIRQSGGGGGTNFFQT